MLAGLVLIKRLNHGRIYFSACMAVGQPSAPYDYRATSFSFWWRERPPSSIKGHPQFFVTQASKTWPTVSSRLERKDLCGSLLGKVESHVTQRDDGKDIPPPAIFYWLKPSQRSHPHSKRGNYSRARLEADITGDHLQACPLMTPQPDIPSGKCIQWK